MNPLKGLTNGGHMSGECFALSHHGCSYPRDNDVQLPDEYDQINHDIAPFFALSPKELQRRSAEVAERDGTYLIRIKHGSIRTRIQFARDNIPGSEERLTGQIDLLKPIARHLPDLSTAYWIHDGATAFISHSYKEELLERVSEDECEFVSKITSCAELSGRYPPR